MDYSSSGELAASTVCTSFAVLFCLVNEATFAQLILKTDNHAALL